MFYLKLFLLKDVPEIAAAHHERYDGSGYQKGIRGNEIPLGAELLQL